jgi:hypothetical protein
MRPLTDQELERLECDWALRDLEQAAGDFFALYPDHHEFRIEKRRDGYWLCLLDGSEFALSK